MTRLCLHSPFSSVPTQVSSTLASLTSPSCVSQRHTPRSTAALALTTLHDSSSQLQQVPCLERRAALVSITATLLTATAARAADKGALPATCVDPSQGFTASYRDPGGLFTMQVPCGWTQVPGIAPDTGILASFYSPEEAGVETLALFAKPSTLADTYELGTAQSVGVELAGIAPNGILEDSYAVQDATGRVYYIVHVQFGGNTAGMFGAVREFRCVTIDKGVQYTLRATTARYRYLAMADMRAIMKEVSESLRVL